ncbi:MAG TPA: hypothetical protein VGE07_00605 [Herpetosiphonaceae bacterium]
MGIVRVIAAVAASLLVWFASFRWYFAAGEGREAFRLWVQPKLISLLKGEFGRDLEATDQLEWWLLSGAAAGLATYAAWGLLGLS